MAWTNVERPGYFGRSRDSRLAKFEKQFGKDNWRLVWIVNQDIDASILENDMKQINNQTLICSFEEACKIFYEQSYYDYLVTFPHHLDYICSFGECIDNAITNIDSGCDYTKQEAYSTHIQDIAVRNVLRRLNMKFLGPLDKLLTIRSYASTGHQFGPGNIPFYDHRLITQPSLCPSWANLNSVEDFWQSNKWLQILEPNSDICNQLDLL